MSKQAYIQELPVVGSAPSTPNANWHKLYKKTDNYIYTLNDAAAERALAYRKSFQRLAANGALTADVTEITAGTAYTLPAAGTVGIEMRVINKSGASITISSSSVIGNKTTGNPTSLVLKYQEWLDVYDTGTEWRIV